jgi:Flp pilus assembly protein TadG
MNAGVQMGRVKNLTTGGGRLGNVFRACRKSQRGVAALEFSIIAGILGFLLVNVFDFAAYAYMRMQVANAAEMGAQAAWQACDPSVQPATTKCGTNGATLNAAVSAAITSTSLGNRISLAGAPSEGYYCMNNGSPSVLQLVGPVSSPKPTDCTAAGMSSLKPGDYIQIQVTFTYAPVIRMSLASLLTTTITGTSMMRLS